MKNYFETKVTYNRISFHLSNSPTIDEREIHPYHEILLYIVGDTELLTKDGQHTPKKKSLIMIPKETYHFFRPRSSNEFVRLKISIPSDWAENEQLSYLMSKMKFFENLNENISFVFDRLYDVLKNKTNKVGFYAYSAFLMLITELDISGMQETPGSRTENSGLMTDLIEYISENLSENLTVGTLSKKFFVSSSSITHLFKENFGISIHKYITQKRLIRAKQLIKTQKQLSKICADVGFKDYSSFYKAYVRFFGYPPSSEKDKNAHL